MASASGDAVNVPQIMTPTTSERSFQSRTSVELRPRQSSAPNDEVTSSTEVPFLEKLQALDREESECFEQMTKAEERKAKLRDELTQLDCRVFQMFEKLQNIRQTRSKLISDQSHV